MRGGAFGGSPACSWRGHSAAPATPSTQLPVICAEGASGLARRGAVPVSGLQCSAVPPVGTEKISGQTTLRAVQRAQRTAWQGNCR
jgi:hypothetical protein